MDHLSQPESNLCDIRPGRLRVPARPQMYIAGSM
ncbi:hypothetical protein AIIKEEIJ_02505 [Rhodococcus sp. YH1]|nr:hypothetical protein [Rhodococcus sp. YH1]